MRVWGGEKSNVNIIMDSILILMDTVEPQFKMEIKTWIRSMGDKEESIRTFHPFLSMYSFLQKLLKVNVKW